MPRSRSPQGRNEGRWHNTRALPVTKSRLRPRARRRPAAATGQALARGEDQAAYEALHQAIAADTMPRNAIERAFTQSIIDHTWTIQRCRRIEAYLLADPAQKDKGRKGSVGEIDLSLSLRRRDNQRPNGERTILTDTMPSTRTDLADGRPIEQDTTPRRRRRSVPSEADRAAARTTLLTAFQKYSAPLELIVRLRTRAEAQRDAAIRDLERYRASALRNAVQDIEDAKFTEVTVDGVNPETRGQPAQRAEEHRSPKPDRAHPRKSQRA
jgi:hypothetical protein